MELAIVTPLLILVLVGFVQFAAAEYAHHVAQAAAVQALAAARAQDGSVGAGQASGREALDQLAGGVLQQPTAQVSRDAHTASATVSGQVISLVPGLHLRVSAHAEGPLEQYEPPAVGQ